jgi:single-strand DNA-binding protein
MKTNMNKVELIGYAGKDAELKEIKNGIKLANFSLATSDGYRGKNGDWVDNTTWHYIVLWNDMAKKAAEEVKKGSKVSVTGKLNYRTYETQSGEKRYITEIVASELQIIPKEDA